MWVQPIWLFIWARILISENVIDADYQMKITKLITNLRLLAGAASAWTRSGFAVLIACSAFFC